MGSKGTQTSNTVQNQSYAPAGAGYIQNALQQGQNAASLPFNIPQAPVAGFSQDQLSAFNTVNNAQGAAQPYYNQAQSLYGQAAQAPNVAAFYNPMAANVTAQMQNIFGQQTSQDNSQLTQAAGGIGADRIAVGQGNLANQQGLAAGQTYAGLYSQAQSAAQAQQQAQLGAGNALQGLGTNVLNSQLTGAQAQLGTGGLQQQLSQAQLNAPYQLQLAQAAFPYQQAQFNAGITGALAPALGGTTAGAGNTASQYNPSIMSQILGGAGIGTALAGYGTGSGKGTNSYGGGSPLTGDAYGGSASAPLSGLTAADYGARGGVFGMARGGAANPFAFASGGSPVYSMPSGLNDAPINVDQDQVIPQENLQPAQTHMPSLNLNPPAQSQSGNSGKGSAASDVGNIAKIATMFAARGGRAYADGGSPYAQPSAYAMAESGDPDTTPSLFADRFPGYLSAGPQNAPVNALAGTGMVPEDAQKYPVGRADAPFNPYRMPSADATQAWRDGTSAAPPDASAAAGDSTSPPGATPTAGALPPGAAAPSQAASGASPASASEDDGPSLGGFLKSPYAALFQAGLGAFTPQGFAGGFKSGMENFQRQEGVEQSAKRLEQEAKFHEDQFTKSTPYQQFEMRKPIPIGQHIDPTTYMPMTTYGIPQPDGSIKPVDTSTSTNPDAALPPKSSPTQGWIPGKNVPEGVNPEALAGESDDIANMVKSIDEGRSKLSDVPMRQRFMVERKLHAYDKNWDETVWGLRNKQQSDLATNGTAGKMLTSVNQLLPHLKTAFDSANELANTNYPEANTIKNWWLTATGDPRVKQFETVREVAAMDAARLLRGTGQMAEADIEHWRSTLASAGSPQQLQGVIRLLSNDLIGARISSIKQEYRQNMRQEPPEFLSPEAKQALAGMQPQAKPGAAAPAPAAAAPQAAPSQGAAPTAQPPVAGARQAPDGHWYVQQNGKYFRVDQ
jgi:hypothetical protein